MLPRFAESAARGRPSGLRARALGSAAQARKVQIPSGKEVNMHRTLRLGLVVWIAGAGLAVTGCHTMATAARGAGEATADTARAVGGAVATAARGTARFVGNTFDAADDELD
jgi:hypothetical protein